MLFQGGLPGKDDVYFIVEILDHNFRFEIHPVIVFGTAAVLFLLPVLAHHNERRLNGRHAGEHQIQQNKGKGIEGLCRQQCVDHHPEDQHASEGKNECPTPRKFRDGVRRPLTEGVFFLLTRGIFGNFAVRQQVQHFLVRHVMADILENFS